MNDDVTVRDVLRREYLGVSEADTVADTASLMLEEDGDAVVVLHGSEPVGLVTQRDVLRAAVERGDLSSIAVSTIMDEHPPTVDANAPLGSVTDRMSGNQERQLLVMNDDDLLGVISEHDVVTASALETGVNGGQEPAPDTDTVTATAETAAGDDEYSNQGICEICGSLTRDLSTFNGQLVCNDCKNV